MQPDLADLRITPSQLEKLTGMDISDSFIGRVYRPSVFRSFQRLFPFLVTEVLIFGLILIFCLPLGLVVGRGLGILSGDSGSLLSFLGIMGSVSILLFVAWNFYIYLKGRDLKALANLLDQVDKHNEIIEAVHIMDELSAIKQDMLQLIDREEVIKALTATRESLMNALLTEKVLRKHQKFITRRQELFTNIETNLAILQTLQIDGQATEYGQLLNQALQIGLSVQQEIEQLND